MAEILLVVLPKTVLVLVSADMPAVCLWWVIPVLLGVVAVAAVAHLAQSVASVALCIQMQPDMVKQEHLVKGVPDIMLRVIKVVPAAAAAGMAVAAVLMAAVAVPVVVVLPLPLKLKTLLIALPIIFYLKIIIFSTHRQLQVINL